MKMETDKISTSPKGLFRTWLRGTPYICQGVEILTVLGQTLWNKIFSHLRLNLRWCLRF